MMSSLYSYDGSTSFGSPLPSFAASTNAGSSIGGHPVDYFADTNDVQVGDDDDVDGTANFRSTNELFKPMPEGEWPSRLSSLPPSPKVEDCEDLLSGKATHLSSAYRTRGSGRLLRSHEGPGVNSNALQPTNSDFATASPRMNVQRREESSDSYDYGRSGGGSLVGEGSGYKLPALSMGFTSQNGQRRGSASSLMSLTGSLKRGGRTDPLASSVPRPTLDSFTSNSNANAHNGSLAANGSLSGSNSSRAAPAAARPASGTEDYWMGGDVSEVLTQSPRTPYPTTGSSSSFSTRQLAPAREMNARRTEQVHGRRRDGTSARATTFVGVDSSPDTSSTPFGRTFSRGTGAIPRGDVSPSPTRLLPTSVDTSGSLSARTQSDGDLRKRSSSRNSEYGGSSAASAVSGGVAKNRQRSASEPSPLTDEEGAYYPFGLMEMPSTLLTSTGGATSNSDARVRGIAEVSSSTPGNRFKTFGKQQPAFSVRQPKSGSAKGTVSPASTSLPGPQPYDLDVATGGSASVAGDTQREGSGAAADYSVLFPPPQLSVTSADFEDGDYGDLSTTSGSVGSAQGRTAAATEGGRAPQTKALRVGNTSTGGSGKKISTTIIPPHSAHPPTSKSHQSSTASATSAVAASFCPQPVAMKTSATLGNGRRFTFDGAKNKSTPSTSSETSPVHTTQVTALCNPTTGTEPALNLSGSLSHSVFTRTPRPPSRHTAGRADAVVGSVVAVAADTLPSLSGRVAPRSGQAAARGDATAVGTTLPSPPTNRSTKESSTGTNSMSNSTTLPPINPASRRQSVNTPTAHSGSTTASRPLPSPRSTTAAAATEIAAGRTTVSSSSDSSATPSHSCFTKAKATAAASSTTTNAAATAGRRASLDATLSPIASEHNSLDSLQAAEPQALLQSALRAVNSSVRIRTSVDEAALLPQTNTPWPLRPPPASILTKLRVFDPVHPRPRCPKTRELPNGKCQANWEPPETHYTTTLADLAAFEDEEEDEGKSTALAAQNDPVRLRAIQDFEDEIWAGEDVDASPHDSSDTQLPNTISATPMPPVLLRRVTFPPANSGAATARRSPEAPPAIPQRTTTTSLSPSMRHGSVPAFASANALSLTPLPPAAIASSPTKGVHSGALEASLNASLNPSKRYGGIVVDEAEKVWRMREDSIFTPMLDDLDGDASSSRHTIHSSSERTANTANNTLSRTRFRSPQSDSSNTSPRRTKSPMPVARGFKSRPLSPQVRNGGGAMTPYACNLNSSNKNTASVSNCGGGGGGGVRTSLTEATRQSLHSASSDSMPLDAEGHPMVPRSPVAPTFARIIAQRSGGGSAAGMTNGSLRPPSVSLRSGNQCVSQDSLYTAFDWVAGVAGVTGSFGDRKTVVTFAEDGPSNPLRQRR